VVSNIIRKKSAKEAKEAYDKTYDSTYFVTDDRCRVRRVLESDKKSVGDRAANEITDRYISDEISSHQTQEGRN
jgi:hypothetical protein